MVSRLRTREDPRPYVLLLSGTPTPKGWIDLFAQFRILDPAIFGTTKREFEEQYVNYSRNPRQRWRVIGYRHERKLTRLTRAHSFSISQDEAGLAREQYTQNLSVQLPPEIRAAYDELATWFITQIEDQVVEGKNPGAVRTRLLQVTGGFTTDHHVLHTAKVDKLRDYAGVVAEQSEPLLVYCRFLAEVEASIETLRSCGFLVAPFTGATSDRDRRRALLGLRRENGAIVFQAQTGSVALDLSAAAEVVFFSLPDSWESYWGDRNRVLGPHQARPVRFTHLLASGTLDRSVLQNLQAKEDLHAALMQNPRRYLRGFDTI
jgi:SNF2 family DNA or RNA helicase